MTFWCLSPSVNEHLVHLKQVLQHLEHFGLPVTVFLGHHIPSQGTVPSPSRVQAVADVPGVDVIKVLQDFWAW